ncbi:hypothetical protein AJ78_07154 [Emergomyces pasteurianus Ep9510]|uniref:Uncharacterized protein n=1 Tax=Emergomyces pasteurianus Ep9510 TaxID=1447872 RepID=A0A1J9QAK9_9EURO|nr:hypothetical protein AJ78_07154 [Emergomyces pasteurianus Ep9510]
MAVWKLLSIRNQLLVEELSAMNFECQPLAEQAISASAKPSHLAKVVLTSATKPQIQKLRTATATSIPQNTQAPLPARQRPTALFDTMSIS